MRGRLPVHDLGELSELPAQLYVPTEPLPEGAKHFQVELRTLDDGRRVLMVYSSPAALVEAFGDDQDWVRLRTDDLPDVQLYTGFDAVLLDATRPMTEDGAEVDEELEYDEALVDGLYYLPAKTPRKDATHLRFDLRTTEDGRTALMVYTTKPHLWAALGEDQVFAAVRKERIAEIQELAGADVVLIDMPADTDDEERA